MTTAIKERPILFSGPMVRAVLEGRKTMTRRVVKPQPEWDGDLWLYKGEAYTTCDLPDEIVPRCPYGQPGDRLWCKETWAPIPEMKPAGYFTDPKWVNRTAWYAADNDRPTWGGTKWRSPIFMPRSASRITLEVTDVRVERVQDISEADAITEGFSAEQRDNNGNCWQVTAKERFHELWDTINAKRGFDWDSNSWVWVVSFRKCN